MEFKIVKEDVLGIDNLSYVIQNNNPNKNEYKLYDYISNLYDGMVILDVGTYLGSSAIAFAQNKNNTVYTFDIVNHIGDLDKRFNDYENINVMLNVNFTSYVELADIILIDVSPHDGIYEKKVLDELADLEFGGLLLFDDIIAFSGMVTFWDSIIYHKVDLTSVGHWSGTGAVDIFNKHVIEVVE